MIIFISQYIESFYISLNDSMYCYVFENINYLKRFLYLYRNSPIFFDCSLISTASISSK